MLRKSERRVIALRRLYYRAHGDSVQRKERFCAFGGAGRARGNYERADGETRKNRRRFRESFVRKNLTAGYRIGIAVKSEKNDSRYAEGVL